MSNSKDHLKSVVEQSLALLDQNKGASTEISSRRSLPLYVNAANLQKSAVVSASNALAALWNISKPRYGRRPPSALFLQLKCTNGA